MEDNTMNDVVKFLNENPITYVATVGLNGKPKVRPFQFMLEADGKLYFGTNNQKDVYKQIKKLPYIEIATANPTAEWIRISGKVVFSEDMEIKKTIIENSELLKAVYQTADNPIFEIFYLEEAKATIANLSGDPPKEYSL